MTDTRRRLRKWRLTSLIMWAAYACLLLGAAAAALAVFYGANGRYLLGGVLALVAIALLGSAYLNYWIERRIEADPTVERDVSRLRRTKFASMYGERNRS